MADPRMTQNPAKLSEEIGDVLQTIRRLIADDDALTAARAKLAVARNDVQHEDSADFLARRHGGNAALARELVRHEPKVVQPAPMSQAALIAEFMRPQAEPVQPQPEPEPEPLRLDQQRRVAEPAPMPVFLRRVPDVAPEPAPQAEPEPAPVAKAPRRFFWSVKPAPAEQVATPANDPQPQPQPEFVGYVQEPEQVAPEPLPEPEPVAQAQTVDDLDELRDLLREMVRAELHGALGERFSANIRAVIRREVAEAIDAQVARL
ncbi:hypothetical protein [Paracoccus sp. (in: a-proteobacteria)]|uniref:hypothetical protein n=1 Tax=Paracoccus sp. TaxID=267 RepID=UPI0026DEAC6C|nr:hypothetical protein [Paracoccus sp. (in: a-proteobacteria)]MDO5648188.1 hypothetical protein [Paracoccus sp. (in: a-proteobacteria)]